MKTISSTIYLTFALLAFACCAFLPTAQAVVPPPDGGYPNFTTAEGQKALFSLTTGAANTAVGWYSLLSNTAGSFNTATGAGTLLFNTADKNTAVGTAALLSNTSGGFNTATGTTAMFSNTTGENNVACGGYALPNNTTGSGNTAIGPSALLDNTTGNFNIGLGFEAGSGVGTATHVICIGTTVSGSNTDHSCYIGEIFGASSSNGVAVLINADGKLGTMTSSRRFKEGIKPMDKASESILALKPVTFRYKKEIDAAGTSQFGLVAEEVEKVNRDLVVRDKEGKPYSVRYDQVNAMLLNEFLKEHRTVQELKSNAAKQDATIAQQQKQIEALTAGLQKVSAQLEASKPAPQVVNNL